MNFIWGAGYRFVGDWAEVLHHIRDVVPICQWYIGHCGAVQEVNVGYMV